MQVREGVFECTAFAVFGFSTLAGIAGFAGGYHINPIVDSMEKIDLQNSLAITEGELNKTTETLNEKDEMTENYCKNYKGVK